MGATAGIRQKEYTQGKEKPSSTTVERKTKQEETDYEKKQSPEIFIRAKHDTTES